MSNLRQNMFFKKSVMHACYKCKNVLFTSAEIERSINVYININTFQYLKSSVLKFLFAHLFDLNGHRSCLYFVFKCCIV